MKVKRSILVSNLRMERSSGSGNSRNSNPSASKRPIRSSRPAMRISLPHILTVFGIFDLSWLCADDLSLVSLLGKRQAKTGKPPTDGADNGVGRVADHPSSIGPPV